MKWQNLKNSQCPKCGSFLYQKHGKGLLYCTKVEACGFRISEQKIQQIFNDKDHPIHRYKHELEGRNLLALNNL